MALVLNEKRAVRMRGMHDEKRSPLSISDLKYISERALRL
jgi:hypothetical protein